MVSERMFMLYPYRWSCRWWWLVLCGVCGVGNMHMCMCMCMCEMEFCRWFWILLWLGY